MVSPTRDSIHTMQGRRQSTSSKGSAGMSMNQEEEDIGLTASEGENADATRVDGDDDDDDDIGDVNPHLMAYLEHSASDSAESTHSNAIASSSDDEPVLADNDDDDDLDDSMIEAEEEQAIRAELKGRSRRQSIPGPVSLERLRSLSQAGQRPSRADDEGETPIENDHNDTNDDAKDDESLFLEVGLGNGDEDDESQDSDPLSDSSSWGNDFLDDYFNGPPNSAYNYNNNGGSNRSNGHSVHRQNGESNHLGLPSSEFDDSEDDEAYLWQFFFSSEDEQEDGEYTEDAGAGDHRARAEGLRAAPRGNTSRKPRSGALARRTSDPDEFSLSGDNTDNLPLKGRGPLPVEQQKDFAETYVPSGDSTDEDDGVPPERKRRRARGTKAIEVLGSNSFSTRPPILGSWKIKGDKNVGIIDGLTTRTLSPPPASRTTSAASAGEVDGTHSQTQSPQPGFYRHPVDPFESLGDTPVDTAADSTVRDFTDFGDSPAGDFGDTPTRSRSVLENKKSDGDPSFDVEVSDLDLLELGDFLNTDGLSSDDNAIEFDFDLEPADGHTQEQTRQYRSPLVSPYIYRRRFSNRNVPMSAFRNRGSPYAHNAAYPIDSQSPAPRRMRGGSFSGRKPFHARDVYMSPGRITRKRGKRSRPAGTRPTHGEYQNYPGGQPDDTPSNDLIGELIEIGAISPIFEKFDQ